MQTIDERIRRLSQKLDLPPEIQPNEPQVLLSGAHQLTVEGHRGIRRYEPERIEIGTARGSVCIEGTGLQVSFLSAERVCIRGTLRTLTLEEGT